MHKSAEMMDDVKLIPEVEKYSEQCCFMFLSSDSTARHVDLSTSRHELFICCLSGEAIESAQKAFPYLKYVLFFCMSISEFGRNLAVWKENYNKRETARRWSLWRTSVRDLRPHQLQLPSSKRFSKSAAKPSLLALHNKLSTTLQLCQFPTFHFKGMVHPLNQTVTKPTFFNNKKSTSSFYNNSAAKVVWTTIMIHFIYFCDHI